MLHTTDVHVSVCMCACFFNTYVISASIVPGRQGTLPSEVHSGKRAPP